MELQYLHFSYGSLKKLKRQIISQNEGNTEFIDKEKNYKKFLDATFSL